MTVETSAEQIVVERGRTTLAGDLSVPRGARALVVFAHGSGSSRFSPRNRAVAGALNRAGLATLLADLLTPEEELLDSKTAALRFDVRMLGHRLADAADWITLHRAVRHLPIGYFGASTGAAAALIAAAERPRHIFAIVARGGRPDLAGDSLGKVRAPTLLIVGGADPIVLELNRSAASAMTAETKLEIIPNATHLFEESGALERVAELAQEWFSDHVPAGTRKGQ